MMAFAREHSASMRCSHRALWRLVACLAVGICVLVATTCSVFAATRNSSLPKLLVVTDEYAPYSYTEHQTVIGVSTEVVVYLLDTAKVDYTLKVMPWQRALTEAKTTANTLLFAAARTPSREEHFVWIGPITPQDLYLFRMRGTAPKLHTLEDAKKYKLGVTKGSVMEEFLQAKGFTEGKNYEVSTAVEQYIRKLIAGRVDAIPANEFILTYYASKLHIPRKRFEKLFHLHSDQGYYLAINKNTHPVIIKQLQQAFAQMQTKGVIHSLVEPYRH